MVLQICVARRAPPSLVLAFARTCHTLWLHVRSKHESYRVCEWGSWVLACRDAMPSLDRSRFIASRDRAEQSRRCIDSSRKRGRSTVHRAGRTDGTRYRTGRRPDVPRGRGRSGSRTSVCRTWSSRCTVKNCINSSLSPERERSVEGSSERPPDRSTLETREPSCADWSYC